MIQDIFNAVNPVISGLGYEIVDVEKRGEYGQTYITIYIDKVPEGVSLDDCEIVNGAVENIVDDLEPNNGKPYVLEISSPGLDRPFKTQRDFERNYGKEVEIKLYAPIKGKKTLAGVLLEKADGYIVFKEKEEERKIAMNQIALVRPLVKFE